MQSSADDVANVDRSPTRSRGALWTGRVISGVLALLLIVSGVMKLIGGPELAEGLEHLGLPESMVVPLAVVELTCAVLYLIPPTAVIGAILLTGYMGGALCTHWRVGDPFWMQAVIAILVWVGLALREPRLWSLIPWRSSPYRS